MHFKESAGLCFQISGIDLKLSFMWREVISLANDAPFFGPPLDQSRHYHEMFRFKSNIPLVQLIFREMVNETFGDSYASSSLTLAYTKKMLALT